MTDTNQTSAAGAPEPGRRRFLLLVPAGIGLGILTTLVSTAVRFLRPLAPPVGAHEQWLPVAPLAELTGAEPLARTLRVQQEIGWTQVVEEHTVFVLPRERRVLSAVCPHEGCAVVWRAEGQGFLCPCHDSRFDAGGARTSGPAARGLDALPTQVEGDVLKVRWAEQPLAPDAPAQQVRG